MRGINAEASKNAVVVPKLNLATGVASTPGAKSASKTSRPYSVCVRPLARVSLCIVCVGVVVLDILWVHASYLCARLPFFNRLSEPVFDKSAC